MVADVFKNIIATILYDPSKHVSYTNKWVALALAFLAALVVGASAYRVWKRDKTDRAEEPGQPHLEMRQRLINRVLEFAQSQFDSGLYTKARKEFHLAERPLRITTVEDRALEVTIEHYYRSLQVPLVILGEPGTGKTTLLYELATLLAPRNDYDPISVPFGLSNWALSEGPLEEWLAAELKRDYGVSLSLAKSWVKNETVLPLLDGLDEVPAAGRAGCVDRINAYRTAHPEIKPVITCREAEYGELKGGIEATSAVVVRTLDRPEVKTFLEMNAQKFGGLRRALDTEPGLWDLMTTPLMLWIGTFAFEDDHVLPASTEVDQMREHLFTRYVNQMLRRERGQDNSRRDELFSVPAAKFWLHQTAVCMGRAGLFSFHLEDLSVNWLPEPQGQAANWRMREVVALVGGLGGALAGAVVGCLDGGLVPGLVGAVAGGLFSGPAWLVGGGGLGSLGPVDAINWSGAGAIRGLAGGGLVFALGGALAGGVVGWLARGLVFGLGGAVAGGMVVALVLLLFGGLSASSVQQRSVVNGGLKQSATYAGRMWFCGLLSFSVALLVRSQISNRQIDILGAVFVLFASLCPYLMVLGLVKGGCFCIQNLTMRYLLARRKHIPWRYATFLYFAVERVLMIRQGGSFRFIHRMLQEHLAKHPPAEQPHARP